MVLVLAWSSLLAASDGARVRWVEVQAGGRVLARQALLLESAEHGPLLRLQDLVGRLPAAWRRPRPIAADGQLYLPLAGLVEGQLRLDRARNVVELMVPAAALVAGPALDRRLVLAVGIPWRLLVDAPARADPPAPDQAGPAGALIGVEPDELAALQAKLAPLVRRQAQARPAADPVFAAIAPAAGPGPDGPSAQTSAASAVAAPPASAAATPIRRRDPLALPLLPAGEWREWLLAVTINGELVSDGAVLLRGPKQEWAVRVVDLRAWRVRLDEARITTFNGEPYYPLAALPGVAVVFDPANLALALTLAADQFEATERSYANASTLPPAAGRGVFLDYDLLMQGGGSLRERLDALLEVGAFDRLGVLVSDFRVGDIGDDQRELVRLETSFTKDLPARRASLRLGDAITVGGALGRPVRFAGVQFASNFATDPSFVTFPLPSIGGLAAQQSVAELFLDNTLRASERLPPGAFAIDNLPVITGAGELQLKVTDLLGREQLITQSFYVSPRLLRAGLSEYAYQLGVEREEFNDDSFAYGRPLLLGSHRYGITNGLTGEGMLEASDESVAAGVSGAALLGTYGLVSAGVIGSQAASVGAGYGAFLDYEYRGRAFSVGARTRYDDEDFRQIGLDRTPPKRVDQLSVGASLDPIGRVGAFLINTESRNGEDQQSLAANYSLPLGPGSLLVNAIQTLDPDQQFAIAATYAMPLSPVRALTTTANYRADGSDVRVQYSQGRGASDLGPSYQLATQLGDGQRRLDAGLRYDFAATTAGLDVTEADGDVAMRANLAGSIADIDGRLGVSRRLGRAFGMVSLPGHPDVAVFVENREAGRTDEDGYLFVPNLNPYQANRIRIRSEDLPLDTELAKDELIAVPYERSGLQVTFDVKEQRSALATLIDLKGKPLPAGLVLSDPTGKISGQVADRGLTYVKGAAPSGPVQLASQPGQPAYRCQLGVLPDQPMAPLGTIRCD